MMSWLLLEYFSSQVWWCMFLILALRRQRKTDIQVQGQHGLHWESSRTARSTQKTPVFKKKKYIYNIYIYVYIRCSSTVSVLWNFIIIIIILCIWMFCLHGGLCLCKALGSWKCSSYTRLRAVMWLLGIKSGSSLRTASIVNYWAISPAPSGISI